MPCPYIKKCRNLIHQIQKNMAEQITKIKDVFRLFEEKLKEAVAELEQHDQVAVERLTSLESYNLTHPRGVYGLMFNGDQYTKDERIKSNTLFMKRDMLIGVLSIIRFFENRGVSVENYTMMPSEYAEIAINAVSGIEVQNNRPEYERKIIPLHTELVDQEKEVWKYLTTFSVPLDYIEKAIRDAQ
jgi:hypothetical protein